MWVRFPPGTLIPWDEHFTLRAEPKSDEVRTEMRTNLPISVPFYVVHQHADSQASRLPAHLYSLSIWLFSVQQFRRTFLYVVSVEVFLTSVAKVTCYWCISGEMKFGGRKSQVNCPTGNAALNGSGIRRLTMRTRGMVGCFKIAYRRGNSAVDIRRLG